MKPATLSLAITFLVALFAAGASAQGPGPAKRYRNNLMIICERREGVRTVDLIQRNSYIEGTYLGPNDACTFKKITPRRFPRTEDGVTDVTVDEYLIVCKPGGQAIVKAGVSRTAPILLRCDPTYDAHVVMAYNLGSANAALPGVGEEGHSAVE